MKSKLKSFFTEHWTYMAVNTACKLNLFDNLLEEKTAKQLATELSLKEDKPNTKNFGLLWSYLKPYKKLVNQLLIGLLVGTTIQFIMPFLMQSVVDIGVNNQDIPFIYLILIAQLVLFQLFWI